MRVLPLWEFLMVGLAITFQDNPVAGYVIIALALAGFGVNWLYQRNRKNSDQRSKDMRRSWALWSTLISVFLFGCLVGFVFATRGRDPQAFIEHPVTFPHGLTLTPGNELVVNVFARNIRDATARQIRWQAAVKLIRSPTSRAEETQFLDELFSELPARRGTVDLAKDEAIFFTERFTFSATEIEQLLAGTSRLYVLNRISWTDEAGLHEVDSCTFRMIDMTSHILCDSHNTVR